MKLAVSLKRPYNIRTTLRHVITSATNDVRTNNKLCARWRHIPCQSMSAGDCRSSAVARRVQTVHDIDSPSSNTSRLSCLRTSTCLMSVWPSSVDTHSHLVNHADHSHCQSVSLMSSSADQCHLLTNTCIAHWLHLKSNMLTNRARRGVSRFSNLNMKLAVSFLKYTKEQQ